MPETAALLRVTRDDVLIFEGEIRLADHIDLVGGLRIELEAVHTILDPPEAAEADPDTDGPS